MANNQQKYGNNRNLWRKIYPVGSPRRAPATVNLVDPKTNTSYSLDLQQTIRHRDYFQIRQFLSGPLVISPILGEYDEGLATFLNTTSSIVSFNFVFSGQPVVVLTMESASIQNTSNVQLFGANFNNSKFIARTSAPFSGTIRYRAMYAASYPSYFTSSFAPASGTFRASAGSVAGNGTSFVTASWASLNNTPTVYFESPFGLDVTDTVSDVSLTPENITNSGTPVDASAPIGTGSLVNFIAVE